MIPDDVDVLVVGSGCAGLVTAVAAAACNLSVVLVEKTDRLGGTTAYSSGTAWIPCTRHAQGRTPADSPAEALRYLDWIVGTDEARDLREAFVTTGSEALAFLEDNSRVEFWLPAEGPDYRTGPGSALGGRSLAVREVDGRELGDDFSLLRLPRAGFDVLGGMMVGRRDLDALLHPLQSWENFRHAARILVRHGLDRLRYPRGTRLALGNALVAGLLLSLRDRGVPVMPGTSVEELTQAGGSVTGAVVRGPQGNRQTVRTRLGVVLATGGFSHAPSLRKRLLPEDDAGLSVAAPGNTGDGIELGRSVGARVVKEGHGTGAFWMPVSTPTDYRDKDGLFPHIILDRAKPGLLAVDSRGMRFCNEADSYHDFVCSMLASPHIGAGGQAWLVCDHRFLRRYGLGLVRPWPYSYRPYVKSGYLTAAQTIEELASRTGMDSAGLRRTVDRYNDFAEKGVDADFGRGSRPLNVHNGDRRVKPNPCLAPVAAAPFFAVPVKPADLATSAGLETDRDARVLNEDGDVISGLYAVGNDMASIMRGTYPGPGTTLGPAIVFAYRAVMKMQTAENT